MSCNSAIVTEIAGNGSLASNLPSANRALQGQLRDETRVARIIVGIIFAMRYLHLRNVVHRDLKLNNILLDWDWNARLCDFGYSLCSGEPYFALLPDPYPSNRWAYDDSHYFAPLCYLNRYSLQSDVFSCALILYEFVISKPPFSKSLKQQSVTKLLIVEDARPDIPDFVLPEVGKLIRGRSTTDPNNQLSFNQILRQLERIYFKLTANVNSSKVSEFVKKVKEREAVRNA
jgi:serine/threonine protein kinase